MSGARPWVVKWPGMGNGSRTFTKLVDALRFVNTEMANEMNFNPEEVARVELSYYWDQDMEEDPDHLGLLIHERIPCQVLDGWAGGHAFYLVRLLAVTPAGHYTMVGAEFWVSEGPDVQLFDLRDVDHGVQG